eukprot:COSAG06_NODE_33169_length_494_cov_0.777215_2_plen_74_part_01
MHGQLEFNSKEWRFNSGLLKSARQLYIDRYFHNATGCFGNCTDISQILGLTLELLDAEQEKQVRQKKHLSVRFH